MTAGKSAHSYLRESAGFFKADLRDWKLTVIMANIINNKLAMTKTHAGILVLYAKFSSHLFIIR